MSTPPKPDATAVATPPTPTPTPKPVTSGPPDPNTKLGRFALKFGGAKPAEAKPDPKPEDTDKKDEQIKLSDVKPDAVPPKDPLTGKFQKKTPAKTVQRPAVDTQKLVTDAATAAATAAVKAAQPAPVIPKEPELDKSVQTKIARVERMEKLYPEKYAGFADKFKEAKKAEAAYQSKWLSENPGKSFDPEDDAHNDFYQKHDLDWDDEDYSEAIADIRADARTSEIQRTTNEKLTRVERTHHIDQFDRNDTPTIRATAARQMLEQFDPELKLDASADSLLSSLTGKKAELDALDKVIGNPLKAEIIHGAVSELNNAVREIHLLDRGLADYDPKNPTHKILATVASIKEQEIMAMPEVERLWTTPDGRELRFVTSAEYAKIAKQSPEELQKVWTLGGEDIAFLMASTVAKNAKAKLENEQARLDRLTGKKSTVAPDDGSKNGEHEKSPVTANGKPQSPSSGGGGNPTVGRQVETPGAKKGLAGFKAGFIGR